MARKLPTDAQGRVDIKSLTLEELQERMSDLGKAKYRALQVYKWVWQRGVTSFSEMTNISKSAREELSQRFYIPFLELVSRKDSEDGTIKFVWGCSDGSQIESVYIPEESRATLCMSTQVGCAMACSFCLTGDLGLKRQLAPSEIANQPLQVQALVGEENRISNLVLMGMGEPLHNLDNLVPALEVALHDEGMNFSHRKITVSTVGLVPQMTKLAEALPVNLAVSLNATTEEQRLEVMPITKRYSMKELLDACREFPLPYSKRITFEYVMMAGFNDSMEDARRLAVLMTGIRSKVNLIPYNENPDRDIKRPSPERVKAFQNHLVQQGIQCSVRVTRGKDISAACGQLGKA
ncbi:MAG: 23S rRNA (adenine(2503)-C(2))-methyltransferase RlmN [Myxococcota bacterium]|nr:23S rRNA (adenine(2503)-C(2))-methyltransferase RlmN [Myxococcota bacterium]